MSSDPRAQALLKQIAALSPANRAAFASLYFPAARQHAADRAAEKSRGRWRTDPVTWVDERLGEHVWSAQAEVMRSVQVHRRTAVRSGHGVGKSHLASRIASWWLDVHPPGEAFVVSSAPTFAQVRAILWRYIGQAHRKGNLSGRVNQTEWWIGKELVGMGRKPSDHDEAAFQGIHALRVLVILDEACGIPENLWIAADALTTNDDCRMIAIGNPDDPSSYFKQVCESPFWHTIGISALNSPNFTGEEVPEDLGKLLVSASWCEEKLAEWGADSPLYQSKVLGIFPADDPNKTIRYADLAACRLPVDDPHDEQTLLPVELGVDVAGGGADQTVIRERRGIVAGREWCYRTDDPEQVATYVVDAIETTSATTVRLDSTGLGWGVVGLVRAQLRVRKLRCHVVGVNAAQAAAASNARDHAGRPTIAFENARAEMWWLMRELARTRSIDLSTAANADTLVAQLAEPTWSVNAATGRIRIEPKDQVIARLGRSPDNADALLLAYYNPGGQGSAFASAWRAMADATPDGAVDDHQPETRAREV